MDKRLLAIVPAPLFLAKMIRHRFRLWRVRHLSARMPEPKPGTRPVRPPVVLMERLGVGHGDFDSIGQQFVAYLRDNCGVREMVRVSWTSAVGWGELQCRSRNTWEAMVSSGIDISGEAIAWCRKTITPLFPNFTFQVSDIYNAAYNPKGRMSAARFTFPFADGAFTCVLSVSVFTHMRPAEVKRYLQQIVRAAATRREVPFYLLHSQRGEHGLIREGKAQFRFAHEVGGCWTTNKAVPEAAIAYAEWDVRGILTEVGLDVVEPIRYGSRCGRDHCTSFQDIVIARPA